MPATRLRLLLLLLRRLLRLPKRPYIVDYVLSTLRFPLLPRLQSMAKSAESTAGARTATFLLKSEEVLTRGTSTNPSCGLQHAWLMPLWVIEALAVLVAIIPPQRFLFLNPHRQDKSFPSHETLSPKNPTHFEGLHPLLHDTFGQ